MITTPGGLQDLGDGEALDKESDHGSHSDTGRHGELDGYLEEGQQEHDDGGQQHGPGDGEIGLQGAENGGVHLAERIENREGRVEDNRQQSGQQSGAQHLADVAVEVGLRHSGHQTGGGGGGAAAVAKIGAGDDSACRHGHIHAAGAG